MRRLLVLSFAGMAAQAAYAADRQWLYAGDRFGPRAYLTAISGAGTEAAMAEGRVDRASAEEACRDSSSMEPDCVEQILRNEAGRTYRASADCRSGILKPTTGGVFRHAGLWTSGVGNGRSRWRDETGQLVEQASAGGGLGLAQQWEVLCPAAGTIQAGLEPSTIDLSTMGGSAYDHNGSQVTVVPESGLIAYSEPKASLRDVARAGTVVFQGESFGYGGKIAGTAYAFKRGCPPAAYAVSGRYSPDNTTIVLRGAAPIRKGCEVTGYSIQSPHAVLRFKSLMS
ncbi:hypothetical protein [Bosea thiooxidans]